MQGLCYSVKLIKSNFGFHSTADEVINVKDLSGKRTIVPCSA